jgi:hypothetical protein
MYPNDTPLKNSLLVHVFDNFHHMYLIISTYSALPKVHLGYIAMYHLVWIAS